MRCKKHPTDFSSSVGVCASCLRERLFTLLAAQAEAQAQEYSYPKSDTQPPPLVFPRSVSPYISRRKSDNASWASHPRQPQHHSFPDHRFYSTPQVGPSGDIVAVGSLKKKHSRFPLLSRLFRSKSDKMDLEPRVGDSRDPGMASSSSPSSWFSTVLSGYQKKQSKRLSLREATAGGNRRTSRYPDRGMSPLRHSDEEEEGHCHGEFSGYSSESSQGWRQTPRRATSTLRRGASRTCHSQNMSGLAFCLSPLVRATPNRPWTKKAMPPDIGFSSEIRTPAKSHLPNAASFCKNRSRKLADLGRPTLNR